MVEEGPSKMGSIEALVSGTDEVRISDFLVNESQSEYCGMFSLGLMETPAITVPEGRGGN